jgi:2-polyprenyl-3-methyl-5-hydroxy-6-metoxy-1,4-benzoquinol methylase
MNTLEEISTSLVTNHSTGSYSIVLYWKLAKIGTVCDIGCGPGRVARYLHDIGANVFGVDISPRMLDEARRLNPGIRF